MDVKSADADGQGESARNLTREKPKTRKSGGNSIPRPPKHAENLAKTGPPSVFLIQEDKASAFGTAGGDAPGKLSTRLERLGKAKKNSMAAAAWGRHYLPDEGDKFRAERQFKCATWLAMRAKTADPEIWHLNRANFCQLTHTCEACAVMRAGRLLQAAMKACLGLLEARPNLEAHFVTLTVRNSADLGETYTRLDSALRTVVHRRRNGRGPMSSCVGGLGQVETKLGKRAKLWHPHYHGVWFFESKPDYGELQAFWSEVVGASAGANFKLLGAEELRKNGFDLRTDEYREAMVRGLCEVIKYTCKFEPGQWDHLWEAGSYYRGKRARLFRRFGAIVGVSEPSDLCDREIDWETVEYVERVFRFAHGRYEERPEGFANYAQLEGEHQGGMICKP